MNKYIRTGWWMWIIVLCVTTTSYATAINSFNRYLQRGDTGPEILILQRVLNTDPETKVADQGPGSLGQETNYFGEATKRAVINFQKKYDLSTQIGLFTMYSGALDDKTRNFLNETFFNTNYITGTSTMSTSSRQLAINQMYRVAVAKIPTAPMINSIDKAIVNHGDPITITGRNFSTSTPNTITLGYNTLSVVSEDGKTLKFNMESKLRDLYMDRMKDMDKNERKEAFKQVPEIPIFVTVLNDKGTSNAYLIYLKINE